ncbi:siderophore-interacting protein [Phytohalomonas tamaricis]|uniref:siderophore-interacting protein n=1 Tax=Phytohalomonas tamaricis TaxID=2081032 RepID=UPI000D0B601D|nr:siderophore-interacting protein [Phytohalomonas tamaricis]
MNAPAAMIAAPKKTKKQTPRMLEVVRSERITPHMQRITLSGEQLVNFPDDAHGAHIKVFLPRAHQREPQLPTVGPDGPIWPDANDKPITRTYTVRRFDPVSRELEVDFVVHGDEGPASRWATHAAPGDKIGLAGPGGPKPMLGEAQWYLLAGDMTALPAISALLEKMPADAHGQVFIEVSDEQECQPLAHPSGITVTWLYRRVTAPCESTLLLDAVSHLSWPADLATFAWIGGENSAVLALRDYVRRAHGLSKANLYAVPYWKDTYNEERYHQERHRIMDELE